MPPTRIDVAPAAAMTRAARLNRWLARAGRGARAVLGAPDYDAYVAHVRERHPEASPMTREQFVDARLRARYERPGARCC